MKFVSIIVPVYNVEKYIEKCILSLEKQTYKNYEIILVDDGSTDFSGKLCDEAANKNSNIRVVHKENGGLSDARNVGIENANGELLMFVDSDDWVCESFCQNAVDLIMNNNASIGIFGYFDWKSENEKSIISDDIEGTKSGQEVFASSIRGEIWDYAWNKIYRKELFDDIRFPRGMLFEDLGTIYKLFAKSDKVAFCKQPLYYYRRRDSSISANITEKGAIDIYKHLRMQREFCKKQHPDYITFAQERVMESLLVACIKNNIHRKELDCYEWMKEDLVNGTMLGKWTLRKKILYVMLKYVPSMFDFIMKNKK